MSVTVDHDGLGCDNNQYAREPGLGSDSEGNLWAHSCRTEKRTGLHVAEGNGC